MPAAPVVWPCVALLLLMQEVPASQDLQLPETCANAAANEDDDDDDNEVLPVSKACCFTCQHVRVLLTVNTRHPCCAHCAFIAPRATCMLCNWVRDSSSIQLLMTSSHCNCRSGCWCPGDQLADPQATTPRQHLHYSLAAEA